MSAAAQTKLFGLRIPVDPKILFGLLAALIALLFWYNSRGDEEPSSPATASVRPDGTTPATPQRTRTPVSRRAVVMSDRGVLRLRPIDPTKGDIDPTLRLDLLARLQGLHPESGGRSLFEAAGQSAASVAAIPAHPPILVPTTPPPGSMASQTAAPPPVVAIPLKYYGYVKPTPLRPEAKPANTPGNNRGFFLDGDNVLVASEGELLKQRYLVVELTPTSARMEDTQLRQGQTLPVVAAAAP